MTASRRPLLVLFDGECALCSGFVRFLIARDRRMRLQFGTLGDDAAGKILRSAGLDPDALPDALPDSLVVIDGGRALVGSDGVLAIARAMPFPWRTLAALRHVPRPLRDAIYRVVARNRHRWFGRPETCLALPPDRRPLVPPDTEALTTVPAGGTPPPSAG